MKADNLFENLPAELPQELFTTILQAAGFRVERIVSQGHVSPPGFWYDQEESEWVMVVEGAAAVEFEGDAEPVELRRGLVPEHPGPCKAPGGLDRSQPQDGVAGDPLPAMSRRSLCIP